MTLQEVLTNSPIKREDVAAARLAGKRAAREVELTKAKLVAGETWREAFVATERRFAAASRELNELVKEYDAPRKAFLKANREQHAAAVEQLVLAVKRQAELARDVALDDVSLAEARGFAELLERDLTAEKEPAMQSHLQSELDKARGKVAELEREQAKKRANIAELKNRLPGLQTRLDEIVAELAL